MRSKVLMALLITAAVALTGMHMFVPRNNVSWRLTHSAAAARSGERMSVSMPQGTVDINRADAAELDTLPGIGPKLAQAIIEDREQYGPFYYPEDLIHVKGIGAKTLAKLWEQLKLP